MKKILITGANSYIGTSLEIWLRQWVDRYSVDTVNMIDGTWKDKDFSEYDVVFHVAGIAHMKETKENSNLYYKVNRDLAYEVAKKSKLEGTHQFIFLSSMSVYGINVGMIDEKSIIEPKSNYGKSKIQAEKLLESLSSNNFQVAVLRPPMVYGKGCRGNYATLEKFSLKMPFFPNIQNKRSMIYIDNLCEFVRMLINDSSSGVFFPQNSEYVCTSDMVQMIAKAHGKKIFMTKLFNPFIKLLNIGIINKVFGNLIYVKSISEGNYKKEYRFIDFEESIRLTEE